MKLEEIEVDMVLLGILPDAPVTVVQVQRVGPDERLLTYRTPDGKVDEEIKYRADENQIELVPNKRSWDFDGDGVLFRLVSEAQRIQNAHICDEMHAVHTSNIELLPHQITAVYEEMLPRQPLRFLLADAPGAGKTIMAGLLIKELIARGDVERCLIVCPGNLVEQWKGEMARRFQLQFRPLTEEELEASHAGEWLAIARLDQLARNKNMKARLKDLGPPWDLIVCDEAHKMSATVFSKKVDSTKKRYQLGKLLSTLTRHFLLMTATPHNGKQEDFQEFMAFLDEDRFGLELGRLEDSEMRRMAQDLTRHIVKEDLVTFDGKPLFPEREAETVSFSLSEAEASLYQKVTDYVCGEFNRADNLGKAKQRTVGFALTILQRRLASSPKAIWCSLKNRRERLEQRLEWLQELKKKQGDPTPGDISGGKEWGQQSINEQEEVLAENVSEKEDEDLYEVLYGATTARTIEELGAEVEDLKDLEKGARDIVKGGDDAKWDALKTLLEKEKFVTDENAPPKQKLIIFTEHRDTLDHLEERMKKEFGKGAIAVIHGGMNDGERAKKQKAFWNDPKVWVLLATDAAGEGINLHCANWMVNYDLPWNPNRLEQRFGRIHRIGQTEVCRLRNLVASETREGAVYTRLLEKLKQIRKDLGVDVFDVLGERQLREWMVKATRHGVGRLDTDIDDTLDHARKLLEEKSLVRDEMGPADIQKIRKSMEQAGAGRLQPHYIESFFFEAFRKLDKFQGKSVQKTISRLEQHRYKITRVPTAIRNELPATTRYDKTPFDVTFAAEDAKSASEDFVCPKHPLLDAVVEAMIRVGEKQDMLKQGAILVDARDVGTNPRVLFCLEHAVHNASRTASGEKHILSKRLFYVELGESGARPVQDAPYLDYRPLKEGEPTVASILQCPECAWVDRGLESRATEYVVNNAGRGHLESVKKSGKSWIDKERTAVKERLESAISRLEENLEWGIIEDGNRPGDVQKNIDELRSRLDKCLEELDRRASIGSRLPMVLGRALIIPQGLLDAMAGKSSPPRPADPHASAERAREIVMEEERKLGFEPVDREHEKVGYDIESRDPKTGHLRLIEVKGRVSGARTVTVTRNEITYSLNNPKNYILAIVEFLKNGKHRVHYVREPFQKMPDFDVASVNCEFAELLKKGKEPS